MNSWMSTPVSACAPPLRMFIIGTGRMGAFGPPRYRNSGNSPHSAPPLLPPPHTPTHPSPHPHLDCRCAPGSGALAGPELLDNRNWFSLHREGYGVPTRSVIATRRVEPWSKRVTRRIGSSPVANGAGVDVGVVVGPQRGDPP